MKNETQYENTDLIMLTSPCNEHPGTLPLYNGKCGSWDRHVFLTKT